MRNFLVGLIGAAAVVASVAVLRNSQRAPRVESEETQKAVPAGETTPSTISLERIRELGL